MRKNNLLNNNGFTLIEIILGFLITSIVIIISTTLILTSYSTLNHNSDLNSDKFMADLVFNSITTKLKMATKVQVLSKDSTDDIKYSNIIKCKNGVITLNDKNLIDDTLSRKMILKSEVSSSIIKLNLKLLDKDNSVVCNITESIRVNLLDYKNLKIDGIENTELIDPIISYDVTPQTENSINSVANDVCEKMISLKSYYFSLSSSERASIKKEMETYATGDWWCSNDYFRTYLKMFEYKSTWPKVQPSSNFPDLPYADNTILYIQPFIYNPDDKYGQAEVCAYISSYVGNGNWMTYMMFSYSEQKWYYTTYSNKSLSVYDGGSWSKTLKNINKNDWKVYTP